MHDVSRLRQILFDQAMKPHGVTRAQWWTLAQLSRAGGEGMAQAELARHLGLGKVAVGGMIDRLEGGGLVERRVDAADRRINRIHVTPRGHAMLDRMVAVGRRLNKRDPGWPAGGRSRCRRPSADPPAPQPARGARAEGLTSLGGYCQAEEHLMAYIARRNASR